MSHLSSFENICSQRLQTLQGNLYLAEVQAVQIMRMIQLQLRKHCSTCNTTSFLAAVFSRCNFAVTHLFIPSFILSYTFYTLIYSFRVQHETTPEPFSSYITQIFLDLPFCLKLGMQTKWCISASYIFFIHYTSNVPFKNMQYMCFLLSHCWDPNHKHLTVCQVLCSAFLIGSP